MHYDYYDDGDDYDDYEDGYGETIDEIVGINDQSIDGVSIQGLSRKVTIQYIHVSGQDVGEDPNFVSVIVEMKYMGNSILKLRRIVHKPQ